MGKARCCSRDTHSSACACCHLPRPSARGLKDDGSHRGGPVLYADVIPTFIARIPYMPSSKYDLAGSQPLPPIEGPKLFPFKDRWKQIHILDLLSPPPGESSTDSSSGGGHGHVFKVRINNNDYALKVVRSIPLESGVALHLSPHSSSSST